MLSQQSHVVLTTVFLALAFISSGSSNGDQYHRRKRLALVTRTEGGKGQVVARFRVEGRGWKEGDATDKSSSGIREPKDQQRRKQEDEKSSSSGPSKNRNRRSFYPYSGYNYQSPEYHSISYWQPSIFSLQRPYYVPVFDNRIPYYYPHYPFYLPPSKKPYQPPYVGPTYLPPVTQPPITTPSTEENTTMPTDNRFGGDEDDDRPIWGNGNEPSVTRRPSGESPQSSRPTRKPSVATTSFPPLVHRDESVPSGGSNQGFSNNADRSATTIIPPTTQGPSKCVWAIIACCSTSSKEVSYNCFDQLGCSGPFWDSSPCETEYAKAAIESALNFYNSRS